MIHSSTIGFTVYLLALNRSMQKSVQAVRSLSKGLQMDNWVVSKKILQLEGRRVPSQFYM